MASISSARRYAQAVLELALEHNDLEAWRTDLQVLANVWNEPAQRAFLEDVRLSKQARLDRARSLFQGQLNPLALNLLLLLLARGRSFLIPYIARQFEDLERQREQSVVAEITTAFELTALQQAELRTQITQQTGKAATLHVQVDRSILGGLVIKVGDQLLDLSVRGKLQRLREQVVGRSVAARS